MRIPNEPHASRFEPCFSNTCILVQIQQALLCHLDSLWIFSSPAHCSFLQMLVAASHYVYKSKLHVPFGRNSNDALYSFLYLCGLTPAQIVPCPHKGQGTILVKLAPPTGCTSTPWPTAFCTNCCAAVPSSCTSNDADTEVVTCKNLRTVSSTQSSFKWVCHNTFIFVPGPTSISTHVHSTTIDQMLASVHPCHLSPCQGHPMLLPSMLCSALGSYHQRLGHCNVRTFS